MHHSDINYVILVMKMYFCVRVALVNFMAAESHRVKVEIDKLLNVICRKFTQKEVCDRYETFTLKN